MDVDEYLAEYLMREREAEARARAARYALLHAVQSTRQPIRARVGMALIRVGNWLLGHVPETTAHPERRRGQEG